LLISSYMKLDLSNAIPIKRELANLGSWLISLGAPGLFAMAVIDSALIAIPVGPDLAVMTLSILHPSRMPYYVLTASFGSTIGSFLLFTIARRKNSFVIRRLQDSRLSWLKSLFVSYGPLTILIPTMLPLPLPFKAIVLLAGVFRMKPRSFIALMIIGRYIRYLLEGWLAIKFGDNAKRILTQNVPVLLAAILSIVLVNLSIKLYSSYYRRSTSKEGE
jgi:membrane protein YqaA with SNARE-associated domain